jgi:hypothetical protein
MGKIEELAAAYGHHVSAPWQKTVSGAQRVMLVVYEKELERTLRARLGLFEQETLKAGHSWETVDCTDWFAQWMSRDDYRDSYFEEPELVGMKLEGEFKPHVAKLLSERLKHADENTVVAVLGVASMYGFLRISELVRDIEHSVRGRLLVFFPGTKSESNYRLLDARDGWNYLANGITLHGRGQT